MQIKVLALKTASSTKLAIFTTLLGASVLAPLFHFQPITGPIVNAMLFLGAVVLPIEYALMLCMLPSLVALSVGTLPVALAPMLPFIMFSNAILVVAFSYLEGVKLLPKARKEFHSFLAGVSACLLKFLFLFGSSFIVLGLITQKPIAQKAAQMMAWPQLITALAGYAIAFVILKCLKKA